MTKKAWQVVEDHYQRACDEALALVEQEARAILRRKPRLHEFVMAMGTWFFTAKDGEIVEHERYVGSDSYTNVARYAPYKWAQTLGEFIEEWDAYLKLTGPRAVNRMGTPVSCR